MGTAAYRVARIAGNRLEVLGEFRDKADAIDMADRAKYMMPFVMRMSDNGEVELLTASMATPCMRDTIASLVAASA